MSHRSGTVLVLLCCLHLNRGRGAALLSSLVVLNNLYNSYTVPLIAFAIISLLCTLVVICPER